MELKICHLYPDILNLYGDQGNIICMKKRLEWRNIECSVTEVSIGESAKFTDFDIFFIGGGQDFEQEILLGDLAGGKAEEIKAAVADGKTFLTICGGYQMLGSSPQDMGRSDVRFHRRYRLLYRRRKGQNDRQFYV